jgi:hypothetical protein
MAAAALCCHLNNAQANDLFGSMAMRYLGEGDEKDCPRTKPQVISARVRAPRPSSCRRAIAR